jgi:hypothetical protein
MLPLRRDDRAAGGSSRHARPAWARAAFAAGLAAGAALFAYQVLLTWRIVEQRGLRIVWPGAAALALGSMLAMYALLMLAWRQVMSNLGYTLGLRPTLQGYVLSFLPRYIPGSIWGYVSRSEWLVRAHDIGYGFSSLGSMLEAGMLVLTAFIVGGTYLIGSTLGWIPGLLLGSLSVLLAALLVTAFVGLMRARVSNNMTEWGFAAVLVWTKVVATYLVMWMFFGISTWFIPKALSTHFQLAPGPFIAATALAWAAGFLVVFVPAGLGVREATMASLLAYLAVVPLWQGNVIAVVSRFVLILAELTWLGIGLALHADAWWRGKRGADRRE